MAGQGENAEPVELLQTRREEALAFFQVNQAGRNAAERVLALFLTAAAIAASVGVAARTANVLLPLPPLLLLLLSYMFQQYSDLTVIGTARRRLEDLVNAELGGKGLIYETSVAEVRKKPPLCRSLRLLQALLGMIVLASTAASIAVAINVEEHRLLVLIGFGTATALAAVSAFYSFRHMQSSEKITTAKLNKGGLGHQRAIWIPADLYFEARDKGHGAELEQETFERLIKKGLSASD